MKKIMLLGLLLVSLFTGCQKDDEIDPSEKPDARLNKTLSDYKTLLTGAENGWTAVLYPDGGAGYSFLIKFNANDRVSMTSDINASTAATAFESTYRLKALQRPALLFDTYSYLHILTDPDETKSNGERGAGKYSDFEFSFESATPETITLTGNLQGSKLVLTKATAADAANFIKNIAETAKAFESINSFTTYFKRLTIGNMAVDLSVDSNLRTITFTYLEGNTLRTATVSYYYTANGVTLLEPVVIGGVTINSLNNIQFNATSRRINFTVNNVPGTIQESAQPARVDLQAPQRFFNNPPSNGYWISGLGFTVNGVPDALNITAIPNFYFLLYWPKYNTSGTTVYDRLGFILLNNNSLGFGAYGPATVPSFTTDGRIRFANFGNFGTPPAQYAAAINGTRDLWIEPSGFYVIQTALGYDLVSAKDAKAWISFEG
jgi:hypothetical protein